MGIYQKYVFPRILNHVMQDRFVTALRQKIVPVAKGHILEIGVGSGLNLPFYAHGVESVSALDPSQELLRMAERRVRETSFGLTFYEKSAEALPFEDKSFDTVLSTWTLCSIPDAAQALREVRRVLKPGGELLFIEHGQSPDKGVSQWQQRLNGVWKRCSGGCHLNRDIKNLVSGSGLEITELETGYMLRGPRLLTYNYKGSARRS